MKTATGNTTGAAGIVRAPARDAGGDARQLPPERAFVVQLRSGAAGVAISGRVEHVVSGRASRFESAEELLSFFTRMLGEAATADETVR